jgi:hypothetical protein
LSNLSRLFSMSHILLCRVHSSMYTRRTDPPVQQEQTRRLRWKTGQTESFMR